MIALSVRLWSNCCLPFFLIFGLAGAYIHADEQRPLSEKERRWLDQRDRLVSQARKLEDEEKLAEALAATEKLLTSDRAIFGSIDAHVAESLTSLTRLCVALEQLPAAREKASEALEIRTKLHGKNHWRTADARLDLENVDLLAKLTPARRHELRQADSWMRQARAHNQPGKYAKGAEYAKKALAVRLRILGSEHVASAESASFVGLLLGRAGSGEDAKPYYERALAIAKKVLGTEHPDTARSLHNLGSFLQGRGNLAAAREHYEQALAIFKKTLGTEHSDTATSLSSLGVALYSQGDFAAAKPVLEQALAIHKKLLGAEHLGTATALNNLGFLHHAQADHAVAKRYFEQALAVFKKVGGAEHPDTAAALNNLGLLLQAQAEYAAARPYFEQALAIFKKARGVDHRDTATALNNLGMLFQAQGDHAAARPYYEQALAIFTKVQGAEHPDTAMSLNNLGLLLQTQGDYAAAKPRLERALAIFTKVRGAKHPDTATSLNNLGQLLQAQGDYAAARPYIEEGLAIFKKVVGTEHPQTAYALANFAGLLQAQGDYAAARPHVEQALAIQKKTLGPEHPDVARSLNDLGALLEAQEDYAAAKRHYEQALAIHKKVLGAEHPKTADSLNNLGSLLQVQGDYAAAKLCLEQALAIRKKALGADHPDMARSFNELGVLLQFQQDYAPAKLYFEQALAIHRKMLGTQHPNTATSLNNLAFLLQSQGDYAAAKPYYEQAIAISLRNLDLAASAQSERQQHAMTRQVRFTLDTFLAVADKANVPATESYQSVLAWKGAVLSRQKRQRAMRTEPQVAGLAEELGSVSGRLATLAFSAPEPKKRAAWLRQLGELTEQKEKLESALAQKSRVFRKATKPVTPANLRKLLPSGAALVDFLEYRHCTPAKEGEGKISCERRLTAFVVRPDRPLVRLDLGPVAPITQAIDQWRFTLKRRVPLTGKKDDPALVLRRLLWQPFEQALEGAKVVLVSPDGALCRLPLGALPGKDTGKYLMEEMAITYVAVPQLLPEVLEPVKKGKPPVPSLLLAGEVDYDDAPAKEKLQVASAAAPRQDRSGTLLHWTRLEGTGGEVLRIRDFFERSFRGAKVTVLRDEEASEEAVAASAPQHRYLHLATHGFFAPAELKSALAPDTKDRAGPQMAADGPFGRHGVSGYHPGLLSGVVLAGANRQPEPGKSDGILTALEVAELDLSGVELAVLSACETGLGQVAGGEGLLGLQRAFQTAGARTVVASLWHVDDRFTRLLMERFYENLWRKKLGKLEALREAQLWLLREGGSRGLDLLPEVQGGRLPPFYWAAFVLSGDWR